MAAVHFSTIPCKPNTACKVQEKPHFFAVFVHVLSKLCTLDLKVLECFFTFLSDGAGESYLAVFPVKFAVQL